MNIVEQLVSEKIADNSFHAANMLNVLKCVTLSTDGERIERCKLYKAWKQTGENKAEARRKAIAGEAVPVDMFAEAKA
jgi:hypothetical protein